MRGKRKAFVPGIVLWFLVSLFASSQETVRVANYNIKFLSASVSQQGDRLQKLRQVIELLDPDVIGLEEIADRDALKLIFPPVQWSVVIDDDSGDLQDVALAVRKPFAIVGVDPDLDAEDRNFLFPGNTNDDHFPNRRDLLNIEVKIPDQNASFFVLVHHAKSRLGGRAVTDPRREGAARDILHVLEHDFDERDYILLGDFNDNPDDRSLNILEMGDPNAPGGPEEIQGPFLINLTEALVAQDRVSHGRTSADIVNGRVETIDPGSRERNNSARGTNQNTGDILFDQILIPTRMLSKYVQGSIKIFDNEVAIRGNNETRASDHLPVFAEFVFDQTGPVPTPTTGVRIVSLLPNPEGADEGHEQVTLRNGSTASVNLTTWKLRDRSGNEFRLAGTIAAGATRTITMTVFSMPLNNSGDDVLLIDPQGNIAHQITYSAAQVQSGLPVTFP